MMGREGGMPRERSDMRRIREVLRLRDEFGASVRRIAAACRMPRRRCAPICAASRARNCALAT